MATQLFLALDNLKEGSIQTLVDTSDLLESEESFGIKFNLDAALNPYMPLSHVVKNLKCFGRLLFADLKMWNGSRTMESVVKTFVDLGVDFINVWASADEQLEKAVKATEGSKTKVLGLTILSHYGDVHCQKWYKRTTREAIIDFSRYAVEAGCHGIILPGTMLDVVKDLQTTKMATGMRTDWYKDNRHKQEATPAEIAIGGADYAVCGSPILKQPTKEKRIAALRKILEEMRQVV